MISIKKYSLFFFCTLSLSWQLVQAQMALDVDVSCAPEMESSASSADSAESSPLEAGIPAQIVESLLNNFTKLQTALLKEDWIGTPPFDRENATFVQKIFVADNAHIVTIGDLHGRIDCLSAIAKDLIKQGTIDTSFKILQPNTYIIFLGDYTDRGPTGTEVWCVLGTFKLQNQHNVFLLRGNHESKKINIAYGFAMELSIKYKEFADSLFNQFVNTYTYLPSALFVGVQNSSGQYDYEMFCHGGIEFGINLKPLILSSTATCMEIEQIAFDLIPQKFRTKDAEYIGRQNGLLWCDFADTTSHYNPGRGLIANHKVTKNWLGLQGEGNNTVHGIVRGHQHEAAKDMFGDGLVRTVISCWPQIFSDESDKKDVVNYLTIDTGPTYSDWKFTSHELSLEAMFIETWAAETHT